MNRTMRLVLALAFTLLAGSAQAQEATLRFEDDAFVIEGKVLKPEVTVVISRENLNKAFDLELKESFLEKIVESVERSPF